MEAMWGHINGTPPPRSDAANVDLPPLLMLTNSYFYA
jgi:hypothetical protein